MQKQLPCCCTGAMLISVCHYLLPILLSDVCSSDDSKSKDLNSAAGLLLRDQDLPSQL